MLHFQCQTGNEAVKHRGCKKEVTAQPAAIRMAVSQLMGPVGVFFLLSFFENAFYILEIPFFSSLFFVVIFCSQERKNWFV